MKISKRTLGVLAALLAVIAGGGVLIIDPVDDRVVPATVTVNVDTLDRSPDKDKTITVPQTAVAQAADGLAELGDASGPPANDETPTNVPELLLEDNTQQQQQNRRETDALPTAGASGGVPGCTTSFVRNQSSRRGVRPTVQVLHYTVSPNRPGRSDVNSIIAFFNRSSSQASSHFIIDAEGNCAYIVPIEAKAWTQAGGNPWAISYEIIATGKEPVFLGTAGYTKLRSVMRWVSQRTGIPMRRGTITGCAPTTSGIVQHTQGGTCWGGHVDIGPFDFNTVLKTVTAGSGCDANCARARSLRTRNTATHNDLRRRGCAPPDRTRSERCTTLHQRHRAIHNAAKRESVKL